VVCENLSAVCDGWLGTISALTSRDRLMRFGIDLLFFRSVAKNFCDGSSSGAILARGL